jgi:hypothetical protein
MKPPAFTASENLPDWVHWLAQDADGVWWGYEVEPHLADYGWYENEVGRYIRLSQHTTGSQIAPDEWRNSLQRR